MKYAVGYQFSDSDEEPLIEVLKDFKKDIEEVYFAWLDMPSGRSPAISLGGTVNWDSQEQLERELVLIRDMGIKLNLLFNANCYGKESLSRYLANKVCSIVAYLQNKIGLDIVTTTSLMIAETVKRNFRDMEVRASVNMRVGTVKGLEYLSDLFDSFYMQREYNRDLQRIAELKQWCDSHGKKIYMLANSGCQNFCSGQTFHDNLVAHAVDIDNTVNVQSHNPVLCQRYYANPEHWVSFLQNSWVRPEDVNYYRDIFSTLKLATRTHANPRKVVQAYSEQTFSGNLLDLLEPGYGPAFFPYLIDNTKFPSDWFKQTTECDKKCHKCNYCASILKKVLIKGC